MNHVFNLVIPQGLAVAVGTSAGSRTRRNWSTAMVAEFAREKVRKPCDGQGREVALSMRRSRWVIWGESRDGACEPSGFSGWAIFPEVNLMTLDETHMKRSFIQMRWVY